MSTVLVSLVVLLNCFVYLIMSCFSEQINKNGDDDDDDDDDDDEGKTNFSRRLKQFDGLT